MKSATKLFTKAIVWEFVLAVITFNLVELSTRIFNPIEANSVLVMGFLIGCVPLIPLVYWLGEKVNWTKIIPKIQIFCGILLQFLFLTILFSVPFSFFLPDEVISFEMDKIFDIWVFVACVFYIFGGIQTLIIGIWLGIKLSRINDN